MEIPSLPLPPPPPQPQSLTTTTTTVKTPDPESEAPQSTKQLSLPLTTNGILKRHKPLHHHQPPPLIVVTYKECLKNHAAVMGGHAIDGCGEFMPSPSSSPSYPTSLKCAACGCHRNFHRREPEESLFTPAPIQHVIEYQPHHRHHPPPPPAQPQQLLPLPPPPSTGDDVSPGNSPSPPPISSSYYPSAPHMLLALSTGLPSPPVGNNHTPTTGGSGAGSGSYPNGKKRFRTKFTQDQKGKMHEIAERIGWKMQKRDEEMINGFCNEIGVEKNVFKVWMHNNKITNVGNNSNNNNNNNAVFIDNSTDNGNGNGNDNHISTAEQVNRGIDFMISRNNNQHDLHIRNNDSFSTGGNLVATKGSSST